MRIHVHALPTSWAPTLWSAAVLIVGVLAIGALPGRARAAAESTQPQGAPLRFLDGEASLPAAGMPGPLARAPRSAPVVGATPNATLDAFNCPCTIFAPSAVPSGPYADVQDAQPLELGVKFRASADGMVTGVRFYKWAEHNAAHVAHLWTASGQLLASATFTSETPSGWQEVSFATAVAINAGTTYIASFSTPTFFSDNQNYFGSAVVNGPLRALANGEDGPNGVYKYGPSGSFPDQSVASSNYWVDVVFTAGADVTPPSITAVFPINGATNMPIAAGVTATFNEAIDPLTLTSSTFTLHDAANNAVAGTVSFNASTDVARFTPDAPLLYTTQYTAQVTTDVTDVAGNAFATGRTWSFTTGSEVSQNGIVVENQLPGNPASEWDVSGAGDGSIQGFATDISVNHGETVHFKIDTDATDYRLDIYRIGYYGGMGARLVATVAPSATLPQSQPPPVYDAATGLTDCGNWEESAHWDVPASATSGVYVARLVRSDTQGASHIIFVVRNDASHSDIVMSTSDGTWQAYNSYGGNSLYTGSPAGRAYRVSYNRPFVTRGGAERAGFFFNADYPLVRWLESNGYDVSYTTCVDSDRRGSLIQQHKIFISVGHDEYWSGGMRSNVEAARNAGVNLAFFSGNEVFWKTRFENSIDGNDTPYRTMTCYKETHAGAKIDPLPGVWTGTWRDPRFSPPADGGRPENALTGTIFTVNGYVNQNMLLTAEFAHLRLWRNSAVASLSPGGSIDCGAGTLGFEWDEDLDNGSRPPGLIHLSTTTLAVPLYLQDYGSNYAPGVATHHLTMYRHPSGARVFGAGTVQWAWGLDQNHDTYYGGPGPPVVPAMQQATMNLFADMGNVQPASPMPGMTPTAGTTDATAPTSVFTSPAPGSHVQSGAPTTLTGTALDAGGGVVAGVEVSVDGGLTWHQASGRETWSYDWTPGPIGSATILCRATDDSGNIESPGGSLTMIVDARVCPCTLWSPSTTPALIETNTDPFELGVRFTSDLDGFVTALRFYKGATLPGSSRAGHLWDSAGNLLATANFVEGASGWQEVTLPFPVPVTHGQVYVASYFDAAGRFAVTRPYFNLTGYDAAPLHAPRDNGVGSGNGVFAVGATAFPTQSFQSSNYWVDVVFATTLDDAIPPTLTARMPASGATGVDVATTVTAQLSEAVQPATVAFELRGPGNALVPATTAYDAATHVATLTPAASLTGTTLYTATLSGASDYAGNVMSPDAWSFTTASLPCFSDRTEADFATGTLAGTYVSRSGDGEVILAPAVGSEFSGTTLPADWATYQWKPGGTVTVSGGALRVDASRANTDTTHMYGPGHSLEFVATFGVGGPGFASEAYQHGGFGKTFNEAIPNAHSAKFTTWAGDGFYAQSEEGPTQLMTPLPNSLLGHPHLYRVDWGATGTQFYVDGALMVSHAIAISVPLRPVFSDFQTGGAGNTVLTVDWARMTPYPSTGTYVSRVYTGGGPVQWDNATWTASVPAGTSLDVQVRSGPTPVPDGSWTAFSTVPFSGAPLGFSAQYIQYQALLATTDPTITPALADVGLTCTQGADATPPVVFSHSPASGATGVATNAMVTVQFSEPMNAATISTASVHLRASGAPADVPATVGAAGLGATLTPVGTLAINTLYVVTVDASVTDVAGNPMASPQVWSFRTVATGTIFETTVADFGDGTPSQTQVVALGDGAVTLAGYGFSDTFSQADGPALDWEPWQPSDVTSAIPTWHVTNGVYVHDLNGSPDGTNYQPAALASALAPAGDYSFSARQRIVQAGSGPGDTGVLGFVISAVDWNQYYYVQWVPPPCGCSGLRVKHMTPPPRSYDDLFTNLSVVPTVGQWYTLRVDVTGTRVDVYIDGVLQLTGNIPGLPHGRIGLLAYEGSANEYDDVMISSGGGYPATGTYASNVFDAGARSSWGNAAWTSDVPGGTALAMNVRTGETPVPDGTWSAYAPLPSSGSPVGATSRYLQYRADLSTSSSSASPALRDFTLGYSLFAPPDVVAAVPAPGTCISTAHACVSIPVTFTRSNTTGMRGYSVKVTLGGGLGVCGTPFSQGPYLSTAGATTFQVVDNHDGSYQIDEAILGACNGGATGNGTLFTVNVGSAAASGTGTVALSNVRVRDCANSTLPGDPGADASLVINNTPPAAVSALAANRVLTGNPVGQATTGITIAYGGAPPAGGHVEVWRKRFGNYPEYDDGATPGSAPTAPVSYPPAGWTATAVTASGQVDAPGSRDFWYYVAYTVDACGNAAASAMTPGALDYVLGDVHDGTSDCAGDNRVSTSDMSYLGAHYGATLGDPDALACLDVGPTSTEFVDGRPLTDNRVDFEDLVLFAIDYETAGGPALMARSRPAAAAVDALALAVEATPAVGGTFDAVLSLAGAGDVQALSAKLDYAAAVVEPVQVTRGALLSQQAGPADVFVPAPGTVDVAAFGRGQGLTGTGELARVTFRVKTAGDPAIGLGKVSARDAHNRPLALDGRSTPGAEPPPAQVMLAPSYPNPFTNAITLGFGMPQAGTAQLVAFDIQGRAVRHLVNGMVGAGWKHVTWDGRDDAGKALAPGAYVIRLAVGERVITKSVRMVR